MDGKTVIITGGNTGIGKETALELARRGARVILGCRDESRAEAAVREIRERSGSELVVFRKLDLASLSSVQQFSKCILEGCVPCNPHEILISYKINSSNTQVVRVRALITYS